MKTRGEYTVDNVTYGVLIEHSKISIEAVLINAGTIVSAFKSDLTGMYSYNNVRAKELVNLIKNGIKGCTSKNCTPVPFALGAANMHEFIKSKVEYTITLHMGELAGAYIQSDNKRISLDYSSGFEMPSGIQYIKLTEVKVNMEENSTDDDLDAIPVRSVSEIALEKEDVSWLKNKKYYVVNDDKTAEDLFSYIENYGGIVSYDTETTGLNINCFGKIGSKYKKTLEQYNEEHPNEKIRADRLVGIILCVEPDVSYYFPCFNRKFKNLYQDLDSPYRKKIIQNTKARYRVGDLRIDGDADMRDYVLSTPDDEWDLGVILMERVRNILTRCHLVAHHGSFEYAVGLQYGIDTNLKDDTMLMHQLMYKFRSTTRNSGEPSNLKYLAKRELGIDQWELGDFFPSFKEDASGTVRTKSGKSKKKKKSSVRIDFSYMDYEGTRVYAPTDGDVTLQLCYKYKKDMAENHRDMEYIYSVEVIVSMAIGYMEFYGHRIDESKIKEAKHLTMAKIVMLESELRQLIEYADDKEYTEYNNLKNMILSLDGLEKKDKDLYNEEIDKIPAACDKLRKVIDENTEKQINLSAPGQVADLLYNVLGYPMQGDKPSVAKKEIKALLKEKNEDGTPKYPAADIYSRYKSEETLQTKFFDNLGSFMYPGGFIFSKYGQIAAATGRMSCIYENSLISTINGGKPIKEIEPGEQVYAYDSNGALITNKVISRICNGERECIELQFHEHDNSGNGGGNGNETKRLKCTPDHRIRLASGKWKQAQKLKPGDIVSGQEAGGTKAEYILEKTTSIGSHMVYDLEVENNHNFIASGICVHNCSKPNAQQYPKVISKIVIPRDGYIMIDADYSQIEYRVLTALAKNTYLAEMFADPDSDYHTLMASLMYGVDYAAVDKSMRSSAKSFNFGIPYGMGFKSLAILLTGSSKPESVEEAKEKYELYFANQPKTRVFFDTLKEQAQVNGFTTTLFKRRRDYSFVDKDGNIDNRRKAAALRQAGNSVIQGCLDGNTLIQTKELGIVKIRDIVDSHLNVWDGDKWSEGDILYSGKKQKCIVRFTNGQEFICSPTHKFLVRSAKGNNRFVECKDLITKDSGRNPHRVVVNSHYEKSDYTYNGNTDNNLESFNSFKAGVALSKTILDSSEETYKNIFMDTELLRGFIMGEFNNNGSIKGKSVAIECSSESIGRDIQKALVFFGIKSKITHNKQEEQGECNEHDKGKSKITIDTNDNELFLDMLNNNKQEHEETPKTHTIIPESVEITDEYIDMYDVCNTDGGYYVADGIITHNTAADIFKIGVARNFLYIRKNKLLGKLLIVNMIHDEQLMEVDVQSLNAQRVLADIGKNMQFKIEGFPPLYIGAGAALAWGYAKDKMAEIHPVLLDTMTNESQSISIFRGEDETGYVEPKEVIAYFNKRIYEFRRNKVATYLSNPDNWGKEIHPEIGSLINLQFNYGRGESAERFKKANGEKCTDQEFLEMNIADFINENNINAKAEYFKANEVTKLEAADAKEKDKDDYDDNDDNDEFDIDSDIIETEEDREFRLISEEDKLFGSSVHDIINIFGCCLLREKRVCGISTKNMNGRQLDKLLDFLSDYMQIAETDEQKESLRQATDNYELIFLSDSNVLKYTGIYVSGLTNSELNTAYKSIISDQAIKSKKTTGDYSEGDIDNRSQAK